MAGVGNGSLPVIAWNSELTAEIAACRCKADRLVSAMTSLAAKRQRQTFKAAGKSLEADTYRVALIRSPLVGGHAAEHVWQYFSRRS